jgi:hypothetical protein
MLFVKYYIKNKYINIIIYNKSQFIINIIYNEYFIKNQYNWLFIKYSFREILYEIGLIKLKKK